MDTTNTINDQRDQIYYQSIMDMCDLDQNGTLEIDELTNMLETHIDISDDVTKSIFNRADKNKDNKISPKEFRAMLKDKKLGDIFNHYTLCYLNYVIPRKYVNHLQKYDKAYSCWPPPIGLPMLTIVEIIFYIIIQADGSVGNFLRFEPIKKKQIWRYVTYMLVHKGYSHLFCNMIYQLLFGITLELVHGWWRPLVLYHFGVIIGSMLAYVADPQSNLIGASGGVYCLITAHIATIVMNYNDMEHASLHFIVIAILIMSDILSFKFLVPAGNDTSLEAHIGGAVAGLVIGIWVLRNIDVTETERILWWIALTLSILLFAILFILNSESICSEKPCY